MKSSIFGFLAAALVLAVAIAQPSAAAADKDVEAVKKVVEEAYVKGIHVNRDVEAARKGFHPMFVMFSLRNGEVAQMTIDEWTANMEKGKKERPDQAMPKTTHEFTMVDVAGDAAVARIEIFKNDKHVFTDYLSLYRCPDGWKIVGKVFHRHP
jgi:hypothetical protein